MIYIFMMLNDVNISSFDFYLNLTIAELSYKTSGVAFAISTSVYCIYKDQLRSFKKMIIYIQG